MELELTLGPAEFTKLRGFIYDAFGIDVPEAKRQMLGNRLRRFVIDQGFSSFDDFYRAKLENPSRETLDEMINRVSTNHTYFYREAAHFEHLKKTALPAVVPRARTRSRGGRPELRVWCAAASYGHEPYGLAIQLRQYLGREARTWSAGLLATDISDKALSIARKGRYSDEDVKEVPKDVQREFFSKKGSEWEVHQSLKDDVLFRRFNLMNTRLPFKKPFDVIFIRNVMIYFDIATRASLIRRLADSLYPGGFLYVGLSESLGRNAGGLNVIAPSVYQRGG